MEDSRKQDKLDKLTKKLAESFVDDIRVADEKTLRDRAIQLAKDIEDHDEIKKNDPKLNTLKEQLADLNGGYRDARKEKTNKLTYIILTLEMKGKL